ncbi:MAG: DinB family protein [Acidobacteriota bacterium]
MRYSILIVAVACSAAMYAQDAAASAASLQRSYNTQKTKLIAAADQMPEDGYTTVVPGEGSRTYAGLIGHIADAQANTCGALAGTPTQLGAAAMTKKADLVAALKKSYDLCDVAYAGINAANFNEAVTAGFGGPQPRNAILWGNLIHSEDMWGQTAVYIRIKNMVPVASQGRGGAKGGKGGGKGMPAAPKAN